MLRSFCFAACAAMLLAGCATPSRLEWVDTAPPVPSSVPAITWKVENRFRLVAGKDEERYYRDLSAFALEYDVWFRREDDKWRLINYRGTDLIHSDEKKGPDGRKPPPRDYFVNYDVRTHSYQIAKPGETDWISDRHRKVTLNAEQMGAGPCVWTVAGAARAPGPCDAGLSLDVDIDHRVQVSVRDAAGASASAQVLVRDIKIVAFGDSFSAGEGNPHTQWRSLGGRDRPATWLDPRCHRSLVSGPSLAAAYLARGNPHLSVTLLHYGCSGASIYDGLVTPWSLLETAQRSNRRYIDRGYDLAEIPSSQVTASLGPYDIAPSQIDMALRDLTWKGTYTRPDFVLLSVGGNDVGFAKIIGGLSKRSDIDGDMRVDRLPDDRRVRTFDEQAWNVADADCQDPVRVLVLCMGQRVQARARYMLHGRGEGHEDGFKVVARELRRLGTGSGAVYLTQYPNFVIRTPGASGEPSDGPPPPKMAGCNDLPFDGRPNLVPSIAALVPGWGLRGKDADQAEVQFMEPLNGALAEAAQESGWTLVYGHLKVDRGHGYCAYRRYHNTFVDSHWDQGSTYRGSRPMGNLVAVAGDGPGIPAGTRIVYDPKDTCFKASPAPAPGTRDLVVGPCLRNGDDRDPVHHVLGREAPHAIDQGALADTTGSVHPNYFGHCSYAAAIMARMAAEGLPRYGDVLEPTFLATAGTLRAETLCTPASWGYQELGKPVAAAPSTTAGAADGG